MMGTVGTLSPPTLLVHTQLVKYDDDALELLTHTARKKDIKTV